MTVLMISKINQDKKRENTDKPITGVKRLSVKILWTLKMIEKYYEQLNTFTVLLNRVIPWKTQLSKQEEKLHI